MRVFGFTTVKYEEDLTIDLTPMLDVVFIMLIFFIVTASFVKEKGLDVSTSKSEQATEVVDPGKRSITIRIEANGRIWVNETPTDVDGVKPNVMRLSAQNPEAKVLIRPEPHAKTDLMIRVLDKTNAAGVRASLVAAPEKL